jgi:hypothetical protein
MLYQNKIFLPRLLEIIIVSLMFFQAILSNTIFNYFQIFTEVSLIVLGSFILFKYIKIDKDVLILVLIFSISQIVSFFQNSLLVFFLNFKIFSLPILFLVVFQRFKIRNYLLDSIGFFSIAIILFELFIFDSYPLPVGGFIKHVDFINAQPLSFFLNFHFAAFFTAIYLIGKSYKYNFLGMDYLLIYMLGVKTVLFSYFTQQLIFKKNIKYLSRISFKKEVFIIFIFAIIILIFLDNISIFMKEYSVKYRSFTVIIEQLLSFDFITSMIYLFPADINMAMSEASNITYTELGIGVVYNEIAIMTYIVQGGLFVFVFYLYVLLKNLSIFRVFILLTLIHYSYILIPLCIAFMFKSQDEYTNIMHNRTP